MQDISEAIRYQERAVQLTPDGHPTLSPVLTNLGTTFVSRFERTGDMQDISKAIQYEERAIQLMPDGHPDLPLQLSNHGTSFLRRFKYTGDLQDISEGIHHLQRSVHLTPSGHPELPRRLANLGQSFRYQFKWTGDMQHISEAIQHQQHAIQLTPDGHADLPGQFGNLGTSFMNRFAYTGDMQDLSEAIQQRERAVQMTPVGHPHLPWMLSNLGNSLSHRFQCTGNKQDIYEAILHQKRAIQLTPDGHADLPIWLDSLGGSFLQRFKSTGDTQDISEAIRYQEHAIQLTPDGHSGLPPQLNNIGKSLLDRFEHTGDLQDISRAIQNQQHAIQLTPYGHPDLSVWLYNLALSFGDWFRHTQSYEYLSSAILNFRLSATSTSSTPGRLSLRLKAAEGWATLSHILNAQPSELLEAYACVIHLLSLNSGLGNTIQRRHETLVNASGSQLPLAASAAALSLGRADKALEWLVEGRCIVWNQINRLRTTVDELHSHDPALAKRLSIISRELENAGLRMDSRGKQTELSMDDKISSENEARIHLKLAKDWEKLLDTIRNIPQFKDFLRPTKCADIMGSLSDEGPIVVVNIHKDRCDALALIAGADEPIHVPLPHFSYQEAERLANGLRDYLFSFGARSGRAIWPFSDSPRIPDVDLPLVLKALWIDVVFPILEALAFSVCFALLFPLRFALNLESRYLILV